MKANLSIGTIWSNAADCLKRYYWKGLGVALVVGLVATAVSSVVSSVSSAIIAALGIENITVNSETLENYMSYSAQASSLMTFSDWRATLISTAFSFVSAVFIGWLLNTGRAGYYLKSRYYPDSTDLSDAFAPFKKYGKAVGYAFAQNWRLVIPELASVPFMYLGLRMINNVETEMIGAMIISLSALVSGIAALIIELRLFCLPYIFAENPEISPKRAVELSAIMTDGYKGKIFWNSILESLLFFAGLFCCFIGAFFGAPYVAAIDAEMYSFLSEVAKENGKIDANEITTLVEYEEGEISES